MMNEGMVTRGVKVERKIAILRMVMIAVDEVAIKGGLPDGVDCFTELVQQFARDVVDHLSWAEINDVISHSIMDVLTEVTDAGDIVI
jgi:hypothetical protein